MIVLRALVSIWVWVAGFLVAALWTGWLALIRLADGGDPGRYRTGRWFRRAGKSVALLNPLWRFRTSGVPIADPRRPYVAVANHESFADILLICFLPWEMKWMSKDSLFRIPFMGWMMRMANDIELRRGDPRSRVGALDQARSRLDNRVSVMIFPEGTRSRTRELLPFKDGAFRLAIQTGCPILPLAVAGTRDMMPKGSFLFGRARAEVRVLEPIPTEGLSLDDVGALRDRVRTLIDETRQRLYRELGVDTRPPLPG